MWSYRVLLVQAGWEASSEARITLAADLADRFEATLIGLAAEPLASPRDMRVAERRFHAASSRAARQREWRSFAAPLATVLPREARAADMLILDAALGLCGSSPDGIPDRLGRPVLLVPHHLRALDASRILIAWDETCEARRAVTAALPVLRLAKRVEILSTHDDPRENRNPDRDLSDIVVYLLRHAVRTDDARHASFNRRDAALQLRAAHAMGADLIVAGTRVLHRLVASRNRGLPMEHCWLLSH